MCNAGCSHWNRAPPSIFPLEKKLATSLLELDVLTYFEKDGEGLLFHLIADLRELAGLAPEKGM